MILKLRRIGGTMTALFIEGIIDIGRGEFLRCYDRRVLKNQAQLNVAENGSFLEVTNDNPCFVKKRNTDRIIQLEKNERCTLKNGDSIGFLPEEYWYEVITEETDPESQQPPAEANTEQLIKHENRVPGSPNNDTEFCGSNDQSTQSHSRLTKLSRSMAPSQSQLKVLACKLGKSKFLVTGYARTAHDRDRARAAWQDVANTLNGKGNGCIKTWKQWAKYWKDKKAALKRKVSQLHRARRLTSGGPVSTEFCLSAMEKRFLAVVGGDGFTIGHREPEMNPFENPSSPTESEREEDVLQTPPQVASRAFQLGFTFPAEAESMVAEAGTSMMQTQPRPSRPMDSPTETMESTQHGTETVGQGRHAITAASYSPTISDAQSIQASDSGGEGGDTRKIANDDNKVTSIFGLKVPAEPHTSEQEDHLPNSGTSADQPISSTTKKPRISCKYGNKCYRVNPNHFLTYCHPNDPDWVQQHPGRKRRRKPSVRRSESEGDCSLILADKRARKPINKEQWNDSEDEDPYQTDGSEDWEPTK